MTEPQAVSADSGFPFTLLDAALLCAGASVLVAGGIAVRRLSAGETYGEIEPKPVAPPAPASPPQPIAPARPLAPRAPASPAQPIAPAQPLAIPISQQAAAAPLAMHQAQRP